NIFMKDQTRYDLRENWNAKSFKQFFSSKIIKTYVIIKNNKIVDYYSYYLLSYDDVKTATILMYTMTTVTIHEIFRSILANCKSDNVDTVKCYNIMKNEDFVCDQYNNFIKTKEKLYVDLSDNLSITPSKMS